MKCRESTWHALRRRGAGRSCSRPTGEASSFCTTCWEKRIFRTFAKEYLTIRIISPGGGMKSSEKVLDIIKRLKKVYRNTPLTVLRFSSPLELLVATMLSAQTTDVLVNKITEGLFKKYPTVHPHPYTP